MNFQLDFSEEFEKRARKFIKKYPHMRDRYEKCVRMLQVDPYYPSLRLHKLSGQLSDCYSVSLNHQYRITLHFMIKDKRIILIDIGHHSDIYS